MIPARDVEVRKLDYVPRIRGDDPAHAREPAVTV